MSDFGRFEPGEWMENGVLLLVRRPRANVRSSPRRAPWIAPITIAAGLVVGSIGLTFAPGSVAVTPIVAVGPPPDEGPPRDRHDPDVIRPGDWERARAYLAALPPLPPSDGDDPPLPDFDV